jgi:hypothetical protein
MHSEELRQKYRPEEVRVLFVGESPPAGGTFFYAGNSNLAKYTRDAFCNAYSISSMEMSHFLHAFKATWCYLDDLCLEPVNHLKPDDPRRIAARSSGIGPLSKRLTPMSSQLRAIIPVMVCIRRYVISAAEAAGLSKLVKPALPFPVPNRHDARYVAELSRLITELREASILPLQFAS